MNDFRQYILVEGMPQAVLEYVKTKDFEAVDTIKRRILKLYRDDVSKFASKLSNSYILYTKDVMVKDDIIHLPIYMTMFL